MGRIIINNRSRLTDKEAILQVYKVVEMGRISNNDKQYCYLTSFGEGKNEFHIATDLRKGSDSFTIYNPTRLNNELTKE